MSGAAVTPAARIDRALRPAARHDRRVPASTAGYGSVAYTGFFSAQVFLNLLIDNAFLLHRRRRHDLRDPVRRHRPVGRLGDRADDDGLGRAGRAAATGARRRRSRSCWRSARRSARCMGCADPALPAAAVHRHAGRHVPRARPVLPDQHRLDQHHRPDLHRDRRRRGIAAAGRRRVDHGRRDDRAGRRSPSASGSRTSPRSAAPSTRSAATSRRRC